MLSERIRIMQPPATIGMVGGGQLGRMFVFEAKRMGYHVIVLDPKVNCPAGQVADEQIVADFNDQEAYVELANKTDVITYEFEHIDSEVLANIEKNGFTVIPSSRTLSLIQNKYRQKTFLKELGVGVPQFSIVKNDDDLRAKFQALGEKGIIKSSNGGYDGKGNMILKGVDDLDKVFSEFRDQEVFIEELIDYVKEVSIIVVRDYSGVSFYPVSENIHRDSILINSIVPAPIPGEVVHKIHSISERIIDSLDDYGVYCIEFFVDRNLDVLVNEIAPRPHNSGHYTIEGCVTSQFEQLVRVVSGMPAGSTQLRMPCAMHNILGNEETTGDYVIGGLGKILGMEDCHFHLYGKPDTGNLRKIGHLTVLGETSDAADHKAREAMNQLSIGGRGWEKPVGSSNGDWLDKGLEVFDGKHEYE